MNYKAIEKRPLFKVFLYRIGFHNYAEYIKLFWEDIEKRKIAAQRFLDTYNQKNERITNDTISA